MAYQLNLKKLIHDIRGPKGVAALTEELVKVSHEVNKLREKIQPQAEEKIKQARANIDYLQKRFKSAHMELDKELQKTISIVKKYGKEAEKHFTSMKAKTKKKKSSGKKKTSKKT